jgi:flagellar hook-length control protein FliK
MSFIDQLSQNLSTQFDFFNQLSNISPDSNELVAIREKPSFSEKKEVFELKLSDKPKNENPIKLKSKKELEETTEVIIDVADQKKEVKDLKEYNLDPELVKGILEQLQTQVSSKIEDYNQEIVNIKIEDDTSISDILKISQLLEKLEKLAEELAKLQKSLEATNEEAILNYNAQSETTEIEINQETSIIDPLTKYLQGKNQEQKLKTDYQEIIKMLGEDENLELYTSDNETKEISSTVENKLAKYLETNNHDNLKNVLDKIQANFYEDPELRAARELDTEILDELKLEDLSVTETSNETDGSSDFQQNETFSMIFSKDIKANNVKVKSIAKPVSIDKLSETISKEVKSLKPNVKQEIRMVLNPENLGKMHLTMTREDNHIKISMFVRSDEAQTKIEQKINDIKQALNDKGFESTIDVQKTDTNNSNEANYNQNKKEDNETLEKQKEKYLEQRPNWLEENETSFEDSLKEIL